MGRDGANGGGPVSPTRDEVATALEAVRARTLTLADALTEDEQREQWSPLMSPVVWDLAHVGNYEEIWLQRALGGPAAEHPGYDDLYDAFKHKRAERPALPLLGPAEARDYVAAVRERVLDRLSSLPGDDPFAPGGDRLLDGAFVYGMVVQHEHQHDETILATRQLMGEAATPPAGTTPAPEAASGTPRAWGDQVLVPGGRVVLGTDLDPWAYDNERPAHVVEVAPFLMDVTPVTNDAYLAFVEDGGYDDEHWWTPAGWAWRQEADLVAPQFWSPGADGWTVLRFGEHLPLTPAEPVQHVCWYEADAYARWAGRRLPTEAEWECAAAWDPDAGRARRYPWGDEAPSAGHANLGQRHRGPAAVGSYPAGVSASGCHQLVGDVWEWTSSDFHPYPGFASFPYREYSEVFWGTDYKVLRGGSWAADPVAVRNTFRNWDHPIRRQIFAGFRCAADVPGVRRS